MWMVGVSLGAGDRRGVCPSSGGGVNPVRGVEEEFSPDEFDAEKGMVEPLRRENEIFRDIFF